MGQFDRIWIWYLSTISVLSLFYASEAVGGHPYWFAALHLFLLGLLMLLKAVARCDRDARWLRAGFALLGLATVFSSIGFVLPAIHPEPYEYVWVDVDRFLLGFDPSVALQSILSPWVTELLQWAYVSFYLMPISVIVSLIHRPGGAYEKVLSTVVFCFLLSFLGYFLWPTLPPREFLFHADPLQGVFLFEGMHSAVDQLEFNRWDCFPSGHVMIGLLSLVLAWQHVRPLFWGLMPVVMVMIVSTMALRYHYVIDVISGAVAMVIGLSISNYLMRDLPAAAAGHD